MKRLLGFLAGLVWINTATAGLQAFDYRLGPTRVSEEQQRVVIHAATPITLAMLPGGGTWPPLSLDEAGNIYAGPTVLDGASGRPLARGNAAIVLPDGLEVTPSGQTYRFRYQGKQCALSLQQLSLGSQYDAVETLKHAHLRVAAGAHAVLGLTTQFAADGKVSRYLVEHIDLSHCKATVRYDLGNPDLLVELGHTRKGGWWVTGSVEQTLLRSTDGYHWHAVPLPEALSSLISSFVVDDNEIWLAAVLPDKDGNASPYLLVHTKDGGQHWHNLEMNDPLLKSIPAGWLEGQKRRVP